MSEFATNLVIAVISFVFGVALAALLVWLDGWLWSRRDRDCDCDDALSQAVAEACWRQTEADLAAGREPRPLFVTFDDPRSHTGDEREGGRRMESRKEVGR